jgi:hypothetical protein
MEEISICGLFAYGLLGILFFPIITVGLMSLFILMCFSSLAYFVKCFQSSIKGFASLQMIFGLLFSAELVTELATLIHSSRSTEFNGIWIFRARVMFCALSMTLAVVFNLSPSIQEISIYFVFLVKLFFFLSLLIIIN